MNAPAHGQKAMFKGQEVLYWKLNLNLPFLVALNTVNGYPRNPDPYTDIEIIIESLNDKAEADGIENYDHLNKDASRKCLLDQLGIPESEVENFIMVLQQLVFALNLAEPQGLIIRVRVEPDSDSNPDGGYVH